MRVVIDTNVIVSAFLSPYGAPAEILRMAVSGDLDVCFDSRIISEYEEVLKRPKFSFNRESVDDFIDYIRHSGHLSSSEPVSCKLLDSDDEPFIEVAAASKAYYLITGNVKHYPSGSYKGVKIVTPSDFLKKYKV